MPRQTRRLRVERSGPPCASLFASVTMGEMPYWPHRRLSASRIAASSRSRGRPMSPLALAWVFVPLLLILIGCGDGELPPDAATQSDDPLADAASEPADASPRIDAEPAPSVWHCSIMRRCDQGAPESVYSDTVCSTEDPSRSFHDEHGDECYEDSGHGSACPSVTQCFAECFTYDEECE